MRLYDKRSTGPREAKMTSHNVAQLFDLVAEMDRRMRNVESSVLGITSAGYVGGAGVTNYHAVWSSVDTLRASGHVFDDATNERTGYSTVTPRRKVDILDTTNPQLRLTNIDDTIYTDFQADGDGNLLIEPTGYAIGAMIGGAAISAWDNTYRAIHLGNRRVSLYGDGAAGGTSGGLTSNAYHDGSWKCIDGLSHASWVSVTTTAIEMRIFDEVATGAALTTKYSIFFNSSGDVIFDDERTGATYVSPDITLRGNHFGVGDTERDMTLCMIPESATTERLAIFNTGRIAEVAYIDESGHTGILGQTIIGSVTIAQIGELDVYQTGCPTNPYFHLRHADVAHGMTDWLATDAFFLADIHSTSYGGVNLIGASVTTAQTPMDIYGIAGAYCSGQPYMRFIVGKQSGTGITNIADAEIGFAWKDYDQTLMTLTGAGALHVLGAVDTDSTLHVDGAITGDSSLQIDGEVKADGNSKVEASSTTARSMANAAYTDVVFEIEDKDLLGEYNHTTGIFTASKAGTYAVSWMVGSATASWAAGKYWFTVLSRNNATTEGDYWLGQVHYADAAISRDMFSNGFAIVTLAATNTLRIKVLQNQGGAINTGGLEQICYFHIVRIA
jgi:hypothetical protein